jgi:membrane-bound inhibitor of C-type lysozyme
MKECLNGNMFLLCIDGYGTKNATFIRLSNGELIKGCDCVWEYSDTTFVYWSKGDYLGHIKDNLKEIE